MKQEMLKVFQNAWINYFIVSCNVYFHAIESFLYTKTQLYGRFPKLHVYAYGAAPCVDYVIADACSQFVTR
jgi:hypothetical protein